MIYPLNEKEYRLNPKKRLKKYYSKTVHTAPESEKIIIRTLYDGKYRIKVFKKSGQS